MMSNSEWLASPKMPEQWKSAEPDKEREARNIEGERLELIARVHILEAHNKLLHDALEPFAKLADLMDREKRYHLKREDGITIDCFWRAREAMRGAPAGEIEIKE